MPEKLTTEEFVKKAKLVHGQKYNYSETIYVKGTIKLNIECYEHGNFNITPDKHLVRKQGCKLCSLKNRRKTTEQFIEDAKLVHGKRYNYLLVNYINNNTKIDIICKIHGVFLQKPMIHLLGNGCKICSGYKITIKEFITNAEKMHNNKYDYSNSIYIDIKTKLNIKCKIHGEFSQIPSDHLSGKGCKKCSAIIVANKKRKTLSQFINDAIKIHGNKYNYDKVLYVKSSKKVIINCLTCNNIFSQSASGHLNGNGCNFCNLSKGEIKINDYLIKNNIIYETQKKFDNCKNQRKLPFDFYLPDYNTIIEFDGKQHFQSIKCFGGEKQLQKTKLNDTIKNQYCLDNNIQLIRIRYDENIIEILESKLFNNKNNINEY